MAKVKWQLDPAHSEVLFKVRHMMVSNVTGEIKKFDIAVETEDNDFSTVEASFNGDVHSITTNVEQRDNHLKSDDFFDANNHPHITFKSTKITKKGESDYEMEGDLTIRETTKPITFKVEATGMIKDDYGNYRAGFEITGKIKRFDYGLKYNALMESGGVVVSEDVRVTANIEIFRPVEG